MLKAQKTRKFENWKRIWFFGRIKWDFSLFSMCLWIDLLEYYLWKKKKINSNRKKKYTCASTHMRARANAEWGERSPEEWAHIHTHTRLFVSLASFHNFDFINNIFYFFFFPFSYYSVSIPLLALLILFSSFYILFFVGCHSCCLFFFFF